MFVLSWWRCGGVQLSSCLWAGGPTCCWSCLTKASNSKTSSQSCTRTSCTAGTAAFRKGKTTDGTSHPALTWHVCVLWWTHQVESYSLYLGLEVLPPSVCEYKQNTTCTDYGMFTMKTQTTFLWLRINEYEWLLSNSLESEFPWLSSDLKGCWGWLAALSYL